MERFKQEAKLLYTLMKLYRLAYIPTPIVAVILFTNGAMIGIAASDFAMGTTTATTALLVYVILASAACIASHYYSKYALFDEVEESLVGLDRALGQTLVALLSGTRMRTDVQKWLDRDKLPTRPQIDRLKFAHALFHHISEVTGPEQARAWFITANTGPDEISPAEAIRLGYFEYVYTSAAKSIRPFQGRYHQD